jgi:uncharacterized damage-inducible protein DinB
MYPTLESRADLLKMLDELAENRKQILAECEALPAAKLNDPVIPGTWSLLKNLAHLAWAEMLMLTWIKKRPEAVQPTERPPEPKGDLPAMRQALDQAHATVIAFLNDNPESVLTEKCLFGNRGEQTVGGVFFHLVEHEIHHRAFIRHKLGKLKG